MLILFRLSIEIKLLNCYNIYKLKKGQDKVLYRCKMMKIRKNAEQKNFIVDKRFYTEYELLSMARQNIIFCMDDSFNIKYITDISEVKDCCFRIFADNCKDVKVIYNKRFGFYQTVVTTDNDQLICICL